MTKPGVGASAKLPWNIERRRFAKKSDAPYVGWDKLGRPYYIRDIGGRWQATGRDHPQILFAPTLRELSESLSRHEAPVPPSDPLKEGP